MHLARFGEHLQCSKAQLASHGALAQQDQPRAVKKGQVSHIQLHSCLLVWTASQALQTCRNMQRSIVMPARWLQEKKASKLERKKAKNDSATADSSQNAAAPSPPAPTHPSPSPSSPSPPAPSPAATAGLDAAGDEEDPAQPAGTSKAASDEATAAKEGTSGTRDVGSNTILADASDQAPAGREEQQREGHSQHQQLSISTDTSHAEPQDVLHEFESLSPMLPDMPKHDMQDDLAGLFQAAFDTCRKEMSPHGPPPDSPFGSHDQDHEEEDYSLYNDADEAMGRDQAEGTALDASDEEEGEKSGEMAGALLEGFIGDSEHVAQVSGVAQVGCIAGCTL